MKRILLLAVLCLLSACGSNPTTTPDPDPKPDPDPTSALGDSPTLTGTIANLDEVKGGVDIASLKVRAEVDDTSLLENIVIGESTVSASGAFSMKIQGMSAVASNLQEYTFTPFGDCTDIVVEPKTYKTVSLLVMLYSNGQPVEGDGQMFYANGDLVGGQNQVSIVFADRNVINKATCPSGNETITTDVELKKGWNTVISGTFPDKKRIGQFNGVPDEAYKWLIPVCKIGCLPGE